MVFEDRRDGGRQLADKLEFLRADFPLLVLALPRGGAPVAFEVARKLRAPLDVWPVRKLGLPGHDELAMGAIASGDVRVLNSDVIEQFDPPREAIERVTLREQAELSRQAMRFRNERPPPEIEGHTVVLVDDGLATGSTMRAAALAVRQQHPRRLVVAIPVGAAETCAELADIVDDVVCVVSPKNFRAVGTWYRDFSAITDDEVVSLLKAAASFGGGRAYA